MRLSNLLMETPAGTPADRPAGSPAEERDLVARASARDVEAFRKLVDRHRDRAYGLALRIVRSPRDAEEVAQDAFVRAWHALPKFRGEAAFSTWLFRIVSRLAFDRAAKLHARGARETEIDAAAESVAASGVRHEGATGDTARRLETLVALLPEVQRAVVTMFYHQDRSVEDVARILELNENTVKTHLHRARAALRAAWLRHGGEAP